MGAGDLHLCYDVIIFQIRHDMRVSLRFTTCIIGVHTSNIFHIHRRYHRQQNCHRRHRRCYLINVIMLVIIVIVIVFIIVIEWKAVEYQV